MASLLSAWYWTAHQFIGEAWPRGRRKIMWGSDGFGNMRQRESHAGPQGHAEEFARLWTSADTDEIKRSILARSRELLAFRQ